MLQTAEEFFQMQCDWFMKNQIDLISQSFALPAAIYFDDQIMVLESLESAQSLLHSKRASLLSQGYKRTDCRVIAQSITARNHMSIWVEINHLDAQHSTISTSTARYFCARTDSGQLRVQLVEYLKLPEDNLVEQAKTPELMF